MNPNLAMREFDWRNSFPASIALVDENWFNESLIEDFASAIEDEILLTASVTPPVTASALGRILADC
jgi:hypothetical protein